MFNIDTLNTLIAIVVVLLTLSLVVQAIQAAIKKLLKVKSRQLEESLLDLFETAFNLPEANTSEIDKEKKNKVAFRSRMATLQILPGHKTPLQAASSEAQPIFQKVIEEFQKIGRVDSSGENMLDSISKADLMKILQKIGPETLRTGSLDKLKTACAQVLPLANLLEGIDFKQLSGEISVKFAKIQEALSPVLNDLKCFFNGENFNPNLLLADVLKLRAIKAAEVLNLLAEAQTAIQAELDKKPSEPNEILFKIQDRLKVITQGFTSLTTQIDEAIIPLRVKLNEVENWYDTIMQSFEERYNRGMKTYAMVISFIVVIGMNANIFNVYDYIAKDAEARNAIVASGADTLKRYEEQLAAAKIAEAQQQPGASTEKTKKLEDLLKQEIDNIKSTTQAYAKFGFRTWADEIATFQSGPNPQQNAQSSMHEARWGGKFGHALRMLIGWLIMTVLLSLGAPFWHDTLESLFGIKNLLRKRGDIQNVESQAGAGNPKP
jgi:hypothetical protein